MTSLESSHTCLLNPRSYRPSYLVESNPDSLPGRINTLVISPVIAGNPHAYECTSCKGTIKNPLTPTILQSYKLEWRYDALTQHHKLGSLVSIQGLLYQLQLSKMFHNITIFHHFLFVKFVF